MSRPSGADQQRRRNLPRRKWPQEECVQEESSQEAREKGGQEKGCQARQKEGGQIRASGQYREETGNAGADDGSCSSVDRSSARGEDRPESCGSVALSDRI
jgi:hypothetical protein